MAVPLVAVNVTAVGCPNNVWVGIDTDIEMFGVPAAAAVGAGATTVQGINTMVAATSVAMATNAPNRFRIGAALARNLLNSTTALVP